MPRFHIHRLREDKRQQFRWAPHASGTTAVRPGHYQADAEGIEAPTVYAAWQALRGSERPLAVGDILEAEDASLRIYKYTGFEEARWVLPEPAASAGGAPVDPAVQAPGAAAAPVV
jgi:hypothetical protein